jgi:hypothetical protein
VNELSGVTEPVSSGSVAYTAPLVLLPTCMQQRFADCCVETIVVSAALSVGVHDGTSHAMRNGKCVQLCSRPSVETKWTGGR